MGPRGIALVSGKTIAWITAIYLHHQGISIDLGYHRRRGDGGALPVTVHHSQARDTPPGKA